MKRLAAILVVAALALGCSLERIHYHSGRYDHWIQTPGVITHVRPYVIFRTSAHHAVTYTYEVEGQTFVGEDDYGGRSSIYHTGQQVEVWIDPNDPGNCCLHKPNAGLEPYVPFCMAAPVILALLLSKPKSRTL